MWPKKQKITGQQPKKVDYGAMLVNIGSKDG
jgi:hypothetical protein